MRLKIYSSCQSGMVLVVSLILLLLLTLISVSAMRVSGLEEKMSGNDRDRNIAFQAAEAGLRAGEARILALWNNGTGSIQQFCNGIVQADDVADIPGVFHAVGVDNKTSLAERCGDCTNNCPTPSEKDLATWTDDVNNTKSVKVQTNDLTLASQPRYFITYVYSKHSTDPNKVAPPIYKFTVTARGVGKSNKSVVLLRSYFGGETNFSED